MSKRFIVEGPLATAVHTSRVFRKKGAAKAFRKVLNKAHGSKAHNVVTGRSTLYGWERC